MYQLASAARGPVLPTGSGCKAHSRNKGRIPLCGTQWLVAVDSREGFCLAVFQGALRRWWDRPWAVLGEEAQGWCRTQAVAAGLVCPGWERPGKQSHNHAADAPWAGAVGHGGEIKLWLMLKIAATALLRELELSPHLHRDTSEMVPLVPSLWMCFQGVTLKQQTKAESC